MKGPALIRPVVQIRILRDRGAVDRAEDVLGHDVEPEEPDQETGIRLRELDHQRLIIRGGDPAQRCRRGRGLGLLIADDAGEGPAPAGDRGRIGDAC